MGRTSRGLHVVRTLCPTICACSGRVWHREGQILVHLRLAALKGHLGVILAPPTNMSSLGSQRMLGMPAGPSQGKLRWLTNIQSLSDGLPTYKMAAPVTHLKPGSYRHTKECLCQGSAQISFQGAYLHCPTRVAFSELGSQLTIQIHQRNGFGCC